MKDSHVVDTHVTTVCTPLHFRYQTHLSEQKVKVEVRLCNQITDRCVLCCCVTDRDAEDGVHGVCREAVLPGRQVSGNATLTNHCTRISYTQLPLHAVLQRT